MYNLEFSLALIITELVYIYLLRDQLKDASRCIENLLMTFCCSLFYGRVVVSLTHSPFSFSILHKNIRMKNFVLASFYAIVVILNVRVVADCVVNVNGVILFDRQLHINWQRTSSILKM